MRVIVPALPGKLHPSVIPAILTGGYVPQVVDVSPDPEAYFRLWAALWRSGETFALVEHDIEVLPGQLAALEACPRPWCAYSYPVYWGDIAETYGGPYGLGCVRFAGELTRRRPDIVELVDAATLPPEWPRRSWGALDSRVSAALRSSETVCQHRPNVVHHHRYNYAGAYPGAPQRSGA